jgi:hypothetical protein
VRNDENLNAGVGSQASAEGRRSIIYVIAAIPLLFIGIGGWSYGIVWFYFVLAAVCLLQWFRPTLPGWIGIFAVYTIVSLGLAFLILSDVVRLSNGDRPTILVDQSDTIAFSLIFLAALGILFTLWVRRPFRRKMNAA